VNLGCEGFEIHGGNRADLAGDSELLELCYRRACPSVDPPGVTSRRRIGCRHQVNLAVASKRWRGSSGRNKRKKNNHRDTDVDLFEYRELRFGECFDTLSLTSFLTFFKSLETLNLTPIQKDIIRSHCRGNPIGAQKFASVE
jgi:hypothetical protein